MNQDVGRFNIFVSKALLVHPSETVRQASKRSMKHLPQVPSGALRCARQELFQTLSQAAMICDWPSNKSDFHRGLVCSVHLYEVTVVLQGLYCLHLFSKGLQDEWPCLSLGIHDLQSELYTVRSPRGFHHRPESSMAQTSNDIVWEVSSPGE